VPFDGGCRRCSRLAAFLDDVRAEHPGYHAAPVAPFGASSPALLVVGLAPGMHGANRTGRPFTGDHAGILLYQTLHAHGFASAAESLHAGDGLELIDCRITNAVKCLPPANKPKGEEVSTCNAYLAGELGTLAPHAVVLALGRIAHEAVVRGLGGRQKDHPFAHGAEHSLSNGLLLVDSYHCSRYNTQTRRLTSEMFDALFVRLRRLVDERK
jgi:uracil-DNA glycosylase family 4